MGRFIRKNQDIILITFTVFLFAVVGGAYLWGIRLILDAVSTSLSPPGTAATAVEVRAEEARTILRSHGVSVPE